MYTLNSLQINLKRKK